MGEEVGRLAQDIHRLSRQLHPSMVDHLGLMAALRAECAAFSKQHGIAAELVPAEIPDSLPGEIALSLYRIVQESLWNVAKHAQAHQVRITVAQADGELLLAVEDDGKGFDPDQVKGKGSLGLVSMEERVRLVNGRFSIQSHPGKGTRVEARVPVPHPEG
jgi:signal transduction histidine kinase